METSSESRLKHNEKTPKSISETKQEA
jgi:hypothetical protein